MEEDDDRDRKQDERCSQHVPEERQQAGLVAGHQRLEGVMIAPPDQRDEPFVGLQPQQGRATVDAGDAGVLES